MVCDEADCKVKNKPFGSEDEEREPGDETEEDKESGKNEEIKPFWMTFALSTVTTYIGKQRSIISFSRDLIQNIGGFSDFTFRKSFVFQIPCEFPDLGLHTKCRVREQHMVFQFERNPVYSHLEVKLTGSTVETADISGESGSCIDKKPVVAELKNSF